MLCSAVIGFVLVALQLDFPIVLQPPATVVFSFWSACPWRRGRRGHRGSAVRDSGSQVGRYLGGLDGIRGAGALAVITAHCSIHFAPDTTPAGVAQILAQALTVFFALSGMLIYTPFARDIARGERRLRLRPLREAPFAPHLPGVPVHLRRRRLRASGGVLDQRRGDVHYRVGCRHRDDDRSRPPAAQPVIASELLPDHLQTGVNPSWSLTTELTFYALLPVLAVWLVGRSQRRFALALLPAGILGVAGLAGRAWAEQRFAPSSGCPRSSQSSGRTASPSSRAACSAWVTRSPPGWWSPSSSCSPSVGS